MAENAYPAVVFDLDGTILDVHRRYWTLYSTILKDLGHVPLGQTSYWTKRRSGAPIPHTTPDTYLTRFRAHIEDTTLLALDAPFDGMTDVIEDVSRQYVSYLVTLRKERPRLLSQLKALGLDRWFPANRVLTPENQKAPVIAAISPLPIVVVGDTDADVGAARALSIASVGVSWGLLSPLRMRALSPDFTLSSPQKLRAIIDQIHGQPYHSNPGI